MKNMTKALCAALLFAAPIPAFAQGIAVHDSANLIQQINAVRQAIQVVAQGKQQIQEAQKLYQDLNKLTDIPQLAQQLKSDALRELDLSGGSNNLTHLELSQVTGLKQLNLRPAAASLQDLRLYYCQLDEFNSPPLKPGIKLDILATPLKGDSLALFQKATGMDLDAAGNLIASKK